MSKLLEELTDVGNWIFYENEENGAGVFCGNVNIPDAAAELAALRAIIARLTAESEGRRVALLEKEAEAKDDAATIEGLKKQLFTTSRALRETARHMHDTARARVHDVHPGQWFDQCSNGWCKEAAAALNPEQK